MLTWSSISFFLLVTHFLLKWNAPSSHLKGHRSFILFLSWRDPLGLQDAIKTIAMFIRYVIVLHFVVNFCFISCVKSVAGYAREAWKASRDGNGDAAGFQPIRIAGSTIIKKIRTHHQEGRYLWYKEDDSSNLYLQAQPNPIVNCHE